MSLPADEENGIVARNSDHLSQEIPPTLLPSPVAGVVSLVTRSSSVYLRLGSFIGGLALDGARVTTLTGLELSRSLIEGILNRAGNDVAIRARGELGKSDAEGLLERSISNLHSTITSISFAAATGFQFSSATLSTASDLSQHLLATLDSVLGSTDSSRAIASIITLIRREFQNPAKEGEQVGVVDLLLGLCGLALLQKWSRSMILLEAKEKIYEQIVWDVVILDGGRRADVLGYGGQKDSGVDEDIPSRDSDRPVSFITISGGEEILRTIPRQDANGENDHDEWPETGLREHIMAGLPPNASVCITTSTTTTKTITIEVTGATPTNISPPPGLELLEENSQLLSELDSDGSINGDEHNVGLHIPRYRVVYRAIRNTICGTDITAESEPLLETRHFSNAVSRNAECDETSLSTEGLVSELLSPSPDAGTLDEHIEVGETPVNLKEDQDFHIQTPAIHSKSDIAKSPIRRRSNSGELLTRQRNSANQKRLRKPMNSSSSSSSADNLSTKKLSTGKAPITKKSKMENNPKSEDLESKKPERKGALRNALRRGSGTSISSLWNKDSPKPHDTQISGGPSPKPPWGRSKSVNTIIRSPISPSVRNAAITDPRAAQRGNPNYFSSRDLGLEADTTRSPSRASFYSIHERRRDSLISQTDTYSIQSHDRTRPNSPTTLRTSSRQRVEQTQQTEPTSPPKRVHRSNKSQAPSIYTIKANNSATSLIVTSTPSYGKLQNSVTIQTLSRTGFVDGMFPEHHLVRNMTRFMRFASASYGSHFLRIMGIASSEAQGQQDLNTPHHQEHHSFSNHTKLPADTILISSFVDPQGGTDATGNTNSGVPMVHYVTLDHESRAVVLTCRGTLGFEDVLCDMTCDYDEMIWRGKAYKVHKGIHASARRLLGLEGRGGRVMATIKFALQEFPDYGLVLTGHSLGGAVTALLAIMISEPQDNSRAFVTSNMIQKSQPQLTAAEFTKANAPLTPVHLPPGRPIHVYAYGPPSTISPSLALATKGLITTIVNGQDLVPYLSLGTLHDLQAVALAFKTNDSDAKAKLRSRLWSGLSSGLSDRWSGKMHSEEEDEWAYATLKTLRATMLSPKLVPPGEVFIVETQPVLQRHTFTASSETSASEGLGRPATRATLRYVKDVETRFGELRFGASMLLDHSPGRYEASLSSLGKGVLE